MNIKEKSFPGMFEGPMVPLILKLMLPMLAGMAAQLLYNVVDTIFVSHIDINDPSIIGGIGLVFPFIFIGIALNNGLMIGINSLVARAIGEGNRKVLDKTAESGLFFALILIILMIVPVSFFSDKVISMLSGFNVDNPGLEALYKANAQEYFRWIIPCAAPMFLGTVFIGILQGEGKMKYVMVAMLMGTIANIILDPFFIFTLRMGIKGAAIATIVSQTLALIYLFIIFLRGVPSVKVHWKIANINLSTMGKIAVVGFPQALSQLAMAVSMILLNRVIMFVDPLGVSSFTIVGRFEHAALMPSFACGAAVITIVGQNAGRRNIARVKESFLKGLIVSMSLVAVVSAVLVIVAPRLYSFFTEDINVLRYAILQTRLTVYVFIFASVGIVGRSVFQGLGFPLPALFLTFLRVLLISVPLAYIFVYLFRLEMFETQLFGIWMGNTIGGFLTAFVSFFWIMNLVKRLQSGKLEMRHT